MNEATQVVGYILIALVIIAVALLPWLNTSSFIGACFIEFGFLCTTFVTFVASIWNPSETKTVVAWISLPVVAIYGFNLFLAWRVRHAEYF